MVPLPSPFSRIPAFRVSKTSFTVATSSLYYSSFEALALSTSPLGLSRTEPLKSGSGATCRVSASFQRELRERAGSWNINSRILVGDPFSYSFRLLGAWGFCTVFVLVELKRSFLQSRQIGAQNPHPNSHQLPSKRFGVLKGHQ